MNIFTKPLLTTVAFLATILPSTAQNSSDDGGFDHSHSALTQVLAEHVEDGLVDYAALAKSPEQLLDYLGELAFIPKSDFDSWTRDQQLAFLINQYNAETLELMIEHYPIKSIKLIGGVFGNPWEEPVVSYFGQPATLNYLEKDVILAYGEPRVHFALVCAALGCPPLRNEAFSGDRLDEQLDEQAGVFLKQEFKNYVDLEDGSLHLSPIFKWYGSDFGETEADLVASVKPHLPETAAAKLAKEPDLSYTFYDWSLNVKGAEIPEKAPTGLQRWMLEGLQRIDLLGPLRHIAYIIGYVVCSVLLFSGLILTLSGGFLFGPVWGVVIVSLASNLASATSFLIGRYVARKPIERRFGANEKFKAIDNAVAEQGWKIVFLTRLTPFLPYVALNYIYGLTKVRFWPYVAANFVGMLPGTIAYVWIGSFAKNLTELAAGGGKSHWSTTALLVVGIGAAFTVSIYITKIARKALAAHVPAEEKAETESDKTPA
ncbi:MAG: putative membrane protein YdjX (TVP38/TMEM64 family) [Verrucomicrobiales bacterium]|jgi:uncharacterized membrane protein YdjX (TVP38/TMEM64 family)